MSTRKWTQENRERINARARARYAVNPAVHRKETSDYRKANAARVNVYNAKYAIVFRARLRAEFIAEYGGKCECCGETEPKFLQLDHVHGGGAEDRRKFKTGAKLLASLKRRGWPKGDYRLLCANCNHGRAINGGVCPHVSSVQRAA